jgi:hypothetical protein
VRAFIVAAAAAAVLVVVVLPAIAGYLRPPLCSTVESGGVVVQSFCISWDATLGRYQTPPPGVPADYGVRLPAGIEPTLVAALLFVAATFTFWLGLSIVARWRLHERSRDRV